MDLLQDRPCRPAASSRTTDRALRQLLSTLTFLLPASLPSFAAAEDKAKPNTLTPKEISDGWILLFDGETFGGWKIDGEATVEDGELILEVKDGSAASLLKYRVGPLLDRLKEHFGEGTVARIKIRVGTRKKGL